MKLAATVGSTALMLTDSTFLLHAVSKDLMIFLPSSDSRGLRLPWWPFYFTKHRVNVTGVLTKSVSLKMTSARFHTFQHQAMWRLGCLSLPFCVLALLVAPQTHWASFSSLQQRDWACAGGVGLERLSLLRTQLQELHSWPFLFFQTLVQMSLSQRDLVKLR